MRFSSHLDSQVNPPRSILGTIWDPKWGPKIDQKSISEGSKKGSDFCSVFIHFLDPVLGSIWALGSPKWSDATRALSFRFGICIGTPFWTPTWPPRAPQDPLLDAFLDANLAAQSSPRPPKSSLTRPRHPTSRRMGWWGTREAYRIKAAKLLK